MTPGRLLAALRLAWSPATGSLWRPEEPARGRCDVTALVVQEWLGGEILKTPLPEGRHFHNRVDRARLDLTAGQFAAPIAYRDLPSSCAESLAATRPGQVETLRARLRTAAHGAGGGHDAMHGGIRR
ncbi:YunG family protein [Paracraurococcus ruber]|uniref:Uncharacterized protein n=1 Tax=Paracraurococcus ruber TaxID=77675 RepID=A0ABS1D319_9PROT|nr:hypothetical protein [Paracraurococcus ruber]MBK1660946.1 hypothetical protein [Paracraurococcus ruber]TDG24346.1 hypothetical protein E2C05_26055 [Paracraurococcus ruber]